MAWVTLVLNCCLPLQIVRSIQAYIFYQFLLFFIILIGNGKMLVAQCINSDCSAHLTKVHRSVSVHPFLFMIWKNFRFINQLRIISYSQIQTWNLFFQFRKQCSFFASWLYILVHFFLISSKTALKLTYVLKFHEQLILLRNFCGKTISSRIKTKSQKNIYFFET